MQPFPIDWLTPTYNSVWNNLAGFRQFNIDLLGYGSVNGPPVDPGRSFDINEKSLAGYGQLNFKRGSGRRPSRTASSAFAWSAAKDTINGTIRPANPGATPDQRQERLYGLAAQREPQRPLRA